MENSSKYSTESDGSQDSDSDTESKQRKKSKDEKQLNKPSKSQKYYTEKKKIIENISPTFLRTKLKDILDFITQESEASLIIRHLAPIEAKFLENFLGIYRRRHIFEDFFSPACVDMFKKISSLLKSHESTFKLDVCAAKTDMQSKKREVTILKVPSYSSSVKNWRASPNPNEQKPKQLTGNISKQDSNLNNQSAPPSYDECNSKQKKELHIFITPNKDLRKVVKYDSENEPNLTEASDHLKPKIKSLRLPKQLKLASPKTLNIKNELEKNHSPKNVKKDESGLKFNEPFQDELPLQDELSVSRVAFNDGLKGLSSSESKLSERHKCFLKKILKETNSAMCKTELATIFKEILEKKSEEEFIKINSDKLVLEESQPAKVSGKCFDENVNLKANDNKSAELKLKITPNVSITKDAPDADGPKSKMTSELSLSKLKVETSKSVSPIGFGNDIASKKHNITINDKAKTVQPDKSDKPVKMVCKKLEEEKKNVKSDVANKVSFTYLSDYDAIKNHPSIKRKKKTRLLFLKSVLDALEQDVIVSVDYQKEIDDKDRQFFDHSIASLMHRRRLGVAQEEMFIVDKICNYLKTNTIQDLLYKVSPVHQNIVYVFSTKNTQDCLVKKEQVIYDELQMAAFVNNKAPLNVEKRASILHIESKPSPKKSNLKETKSKKVKENKKENGCSKHEKLKSEIILAMSKPMESDRGERMMRLMGWEGGALGVAGEGILEPIMPSMQQNNRAGFGHIKDTHSRLFNGILNLIQNKSQSIIIHFEKLNKSDGHFISHVLRALNKRENIGLEDKEHRDLFQTIMNCMIEDLKLEIDFEISKKSITLTKLSNNKNVGSVAVKNKTNTSDTYLITNNTIKKLNDGNPKEIVYNMTLDKSNKVSDKSIKVDKTFSNEDLSKNQSLNKVDNVNAKSNTYNSENVGLRNISKNATEYENIKDKKNLLKFDVNDLNNNIIDNVVDDKSNLECKVNTKDINDSGKENISVVKYKMHNIVKIQPPGYPDTKTNVIFAKKITENIMKNSGKNSNIICHGIQNGNLVYSYQNKTLKDLFKNFNVINFQLETVTEYKVNVRTNAIVSYTDFLKKLEKSNAGLSTNEWSKLEENFTAEGLLYTIEINEKAFKVLCNNNFVLLADNNTATFKILL